MRFLARVLLPGRGRREGSRTGYGPEVLFANWVHFPTAFTAIGQPAGSATRRRPPG